VVAVAAAVVVVTVCPLQSGVRSAPYHEVDPGRWAPDHDDAAFRPFRSDDVSPAGLEYAGLGRASASSPSTLFLAVVVAGRGHGCRSEDDFGSRSLLATVEAGTYTKEKRFAIGIFSRDLMLQYLEELDGFILVTFAMLKLWERSIL
jgi:hypothetical protein